MRHLAYKIRGAVGKCILRRLCDKIRYSNNEPLAENATSGVARTKDKSTASADSWPLSHHERTVMAPRRDSCLRYALVLLSQLHNIFLVSATTTVHFYTDASCKNLFATIKTDTDVGNGQCGEFSTSINSASPVFVNNGCGGISIYLSTQATHSLTYIPASIIFFFFSWWSKTNTLLYSTDDPLRVTQLTTYSSPKPGVLH